MTVQLSSPMEHCSCPLSLQGIAILVACFMIDICLGGIYSYGNVIPYIVSYARNRSEPLDIRYSEGVYIYATQVASIGIFTVLGGILEKRYGPRLVSFAGGLLISLGFFSSYFAIRTNFWLLLLTYGFAYGLGFGITYMAPLACAMKWHSKRKGLAVGVVTCGAATGALLIPFVQTLYINPTNEIANDYPYKENPNEQYFIQVDVLDRVPYLFLIMGGMSVLQLVSSLFLVNPPPEALLKADIDSNKLKYSAVRPDSDLTSKEGVDSENLADNSEKLSVLQMLKMFQFYYWWSIFFIMFMVIAFITSLYKVFGLEEVENNDLFMTVVLVVSSVMNGISRVIWGLLCDAAGYKFTFVLLTALTLCFISTFYATYISMYMFLAWVCFLYIAFGGFFAMSAMAVSHVFGQVNFGVAYGLILTAQSPAGVLVALIADLLINVIDWYGMFFILTGFSLISFVLVLIHRER